MKTVNIECVTPGELRRAVASLVAKLGGQGRAAAEIGVNQATLSQFLGGYDSMTRKALKYFGLEQRKVYVREAAMLSTIIYDESGFAVGETGSLGHGLNACRPNKCITCEQSVIVADPFNTGRCEDCFCSTWSSQPTKASLNASIGLRRKLHGAGTASPAMTNYGRRLRRICGNLLWINQKSRNDSRGDQQAAKCH